MITEHDVRIFLKVQEQDTIQIKTVGVDRYRVNIFSSYLIPESVIPRTKLRSSHYLCNRDGQLKDLTI